jgi:hypothetical protein
LMMPRTPHPSWARSTEHSQPHHRRSGHPLRSGRDVSERHRGTRAASRAQAYRQGRGLTHGLGPAGRSVWTTAGPSCATPLTQKASQSGRPVKRIFRGNRLLVSAVVPLDRVSALDEVADCSGGSKPQPEIRRGVGRCPARSAGDIAAGQNHGHVRRRLSRFAGMRGTGCTLGAAFPRSSADSVTSWSTPERSTTSVLVAVVPPPPPSPNRN